MSQRMRYFILLMLINLVVVVIYLIFEHLRRKEKDASIWMKAGMMLLCPVVGPLFLLGSFLLYNLFYELPEPFFYGEVKKLSSIKTCRCGPYENNFQRSCYDNHNLNANIYEETHNSR